MEKKILPAAGIFGAGYGVGKGTAIIGSQETLNNSTIDSEHREIFEGWFTVIFQDGNTALLIIISLVVVILIVALLYYCKTLRRNSRNEPTTRELLKRMIDARMIDARI